MDVIYEDLSWKMRGIAFVSRCINKFLCQWWFVSITNVPHTWKDVDTHVSHIMLLMFHQLIPRGRGKPHSLIHARPHPLYIIHTTTIASIQLKHTLTSMWDKVWHTKAKLTDSYFSVGSLNITLMQHLYLRSHLSRLFTHCEYNLLPTYKDVLYNVHSSLQCS